MDLAREFAADLQDPEFVDAFIKEWNESRLDMFALSPPNENLIFSGVMRFYFQDRGQKAATKCIRVTSQQTVASVMTTLIEKFCPDMKMLSTPNYELYEIHGTGDVRRLETYEYPLQVQCLWHNDDREGRFVLKNADLKIQPAKFFEQNRDEGQLKRRLSRREKKDLKKKRKEQLRNRSEDTVLADNVYRELPESSFTRTISNPEAVMRRRRQQKLEKRMKEFTSKGGPQTGGILKIFAESLKPEIPYKTILASVKDNADVITKASLEKFLLAKEDPAYYCIVMAIIPPGDNAPFNNAKERIIRSSDCPLAIQNSWPKNKGLITFHLRRRAEGSVPPKIIDAKPLRQPPPPPEKPRVEKINTNNDTYITNLDDFDRDEIPYFLELTPEGKEISYKPKIYYIKPQETIIGSSRNPSPGIQYLQLFSPKILASHCSIVNVDNTVSIVPHGPEADVRVGGYRVYDNTLLQSGDVVQFGGLHTFRFCNPRDYENISYGSLQDDHQQGRNDFHSGYHTQESLINPPISPELKELILNEQVGSNIDDNIDELEDSEDDNLVETTFGVVDGEVETNKTKRQMYNAHSAENLLSKEPSALHESYSKHRQSAPDLMNMQDPTINHNMLPASLSFIDHGKDAFFATVTSEVNGSAVSFKLAPTYTLYLAARYLLSPTYRPGLSPVDRTRVATSITKRIAASIQQTIQENDCLAGGLAFWMANASELLHFCRQDIDLGPITQAAQAILAQSIQESFALLVNAMEEELMLALPAFLDPTDSVDILPQDLDAILNDDLLERAESMELLNWTTANADSEFHDPRNVDRQGYSGEQWITPAARIRYHGMPIMADVLYILSSAMSLLRRCRVNAALTIQLFSQLFHFINMWTFNRIVLEPDLKLCSRVWGHCLRTRLSFIESWAERQGLELAADCHLARVVQAAHLLQATKDSAEAIAEVAAACFKLNSLQLRTLLENYLPEMDEPIIPQELIDSIVYVAESTADELTQTDGREVKLEEDIQLQLPFLLPEEGYSSDIIRGVPPGLQEFLDPLCSIGVCELTFNPHSHGLWTVYQVPFNQTEDLDLDGEGRDSMVMEDLPIQRITIDKGKSGLGLSICATKGAQTEFTGIYIKAVIAGGLAHKDGRIEAGDQILSVNESSLIDVSQTQAAKIMGKSGPVITLEIMKGAAFYHGLAKLVEGEMPELRNEENQHPPKEEPVIRPPAIHRRERSNDSEERFSGAEHVAPPYVHHKKQGSSDSGSRREENNEMINHVKQSSKGSDDLDKLPSHKIVPPQPSHQKKRSTDSEKSPYIPEIPPKPPVHKKEKSTDSEKSPYTPEIPPQPVHRKERSTDSEKSPSSPEIPPLPVHRKEKSTEREKSRSHREPPEPPQRKERSKESGEPKIPPPIPAQRKGKSKNSGKSQSNEDADQYQEIVHKREGSSGSERNVTKEVYHSKQNSNDSGKARIEVEPVLIVEKEEVVVESYNESDYDSDGNLLTKEEKEKLARHRQRQREYEERLVKYEVQRKRQEEDEKKRLEEEEMIRLEEEEDKRLEEEENKRLEEEENKRRREEEERKKEEIAEQLYEAEVRRKRKEKIAKEEAERLRLEEEARRKREIVEEYRRQEFERLEEERNLREEAERLLQEELERKRKEKERFLQEELERKRKIKERQQEEERLRLQEEDKLKKIQEEEYRRAKAAVDERKHMELYRLEQERLKENERVRQEEERRKEKLRMIEERKRKEEEESDFRAQQERRRVEEEERRRKEYEAHVERRRLDHEKLVRQMSEKEDQKKRDEEKEHQERLQKEKEAKAIEDSKNISKREAYEREMSSLDDALREAERIAAEMDMFFIEEQKNMEDDFKEKRKQEKHQWQNETQDLSLFPAPPEEITAAFGRERIETNIDSSDEEEKGMTRASNSSGSLRNTSTSSSAQEQQQRWLQEQKEKREKYRQEQERKRQEQERKRRELSVKEEEEKLRKVREIEYRKEQENRQMEEYKRLKEEKERKDREEAARRKQQVKPPVKAKNFKLKNGPTDLTISSAPPPRRKISSSDEDEAPPPRPPPPKTPTYPISPQSTNSRHSNGFPDFNRNMSQPPPPERPLSTHGQTGFVKRTPEPAVVNQGVDIPEVLDFKSKMKLFGSFQG